MPLAECLLLVPDLLQPEVTQRLEQTVGGVVLAHVGDDQRPVHQACQQIDDVELVEVVVGAHCPGRVDGEGAAEDGQAPEQALLCVLELPV